MAGDSRQVLPDAFRSHESGTRPGIQLALGECIAERFVVESFASSGGMGTIYRARDVTTESMVAVKVLAADRFADPNRFLREATLLAGLSHPAIVRYLAHGTTPSGALFLAMEWLEGEDLAMRLARQPLTVGESLTVLRRACEGLAAAHSRGVVHRDIKPSNLFLVRGEPSRLKVLDFGIARDGAEGTLTQSGTVLGTVGYMSPEQAMGPREVDARADIFALGCVVFECLAGRPTFPGPNAVAVLAKVLREEAPRASQFRAEVDEELDALVLRMLSKNREGRPADAGALLLELDALRVHTPAGLEPPPVAPAVGPTERKMLSVVLGEPRRYAEWADSHSVGSPVPELTARFGATAFSLRGGGMLIAPSEWGVATDQASQLATCALAVAAARPDLRLAIATGRAETGGRMPVGVAIDRAAELLLRAPSESTGVAVDDVTQGLLDASFEITSGHGPTMLIGRRPDPHRVRLLMGRPTPFVGREKELGLLTLTLNECIEDSVARAVLVTGPPGRGKSRLCHELTAKIRELGRARVLVARADPVGAGSALSLVRQLVRQAAGLTEGQPGPDQYTSLHGFVASRCPGPESGRVAEFLGELIGAPVARPGPELRAARDNPQIMSLWLRRSLREWLAAEAAREPLVVVLEDLHWGDLASVTCLGESLVHLAASPILVLALARPEVHDVFPKFWTGVETQEITLDRLTPRAAERYVRETLGGVVDATLVTRILARADGNAFYLEELIRCVAEGAGDDLPETVLALVESRLHRLEPEGRRILRAASVFGELFWPGGVKEALGGAASDIETWLAVLEQMELVAAVDNSRFKGERQYQFRHAFLRDAAYAMLTDSDRVAAHALAGDWLERMGENDAVVLARHHDLGGRPERAIPWFASAANAALRGGNVEDAVRLAERGIELGAAGFDRGRIRLEQAHARALRGDWAGSFEMADEAAELLVPGTSPYFVATGACLLVATFLGDQALAARSIRRVLESPGNHETSGPYGFAVYVAAQGLGYAGRIELAESLVRRVEASTHGVENLDSLFLNSMQLARAYLQLYSDDLGGALDNLCQALTSVKALGAMVPTAMASAYLVATLAQTGDLPRTEQMAKQTTTLVAPIGMRMVTDHTEYFRAQGQVIAGAYAQAIATLRTLLDRSDSRLVIAARCALGFALLESDAVAEAEDHIALALDGARFPSNRSTALAACALVQLRNANPAKALALAEEGLEVASGGSVPSTWSMLELARARALRELRRGDAACAAIARARDRILRVAATIADPELRETFLTRPMANAATLALARQWLQ